LSATRSVFRREPESAIATSHMYVCHFIPPIFLESPAVGDTVHSPLHVTGLANTYEATCQVRLVDAAGRMVVDHYVMATAGTGT